MNESSAGILLVHLGTPAAPTEKAVRDFLRALLSDMVWWPILHGFILRTRPARVAKLYQKIWMTTGSPLRVYAERQIALLGQGQMAMAYGSPSIAEALEKFKATDPLIVLPLFPQYSMTTTAPIVQQVTEIIETWQNPPVVKFIEHYHDEPLYISALAHSVQNYWQQHGQGKRLLFSFHSIPKSYHRKGDPYFYQCQTTASLLAKKLNLKPDEWAVAFQSRLSSFGWIGPGTHETLCAWAKQGVGRVDVLAPGFSTDCLETLEELAIREKQAFLKAGGEEFHYIPALNDSVGHIEMMQRLALCN